MFARDAADAADARQSAEEEGNLRFVNAFHVGRGQFGIDFVDVFLGGKWEKVSGKWEKVSRGIFTILYVIKVIYYVIYYVTKVIY